MAYLLYFLAGLVLANGVPHFVKGITGEVHTTPFQGSSSPLLNVVWGTANFFLAGWLWLFASFQPHALGFALVAFFLGILFAGVRLSRVWERRSTTARKLSYG